MLGVDMCHEEKIKNKSKNVMEAVLSYAVGVGMC